MVGVIELLISDPVSFFGLRLFLVGLWTEGFTSIFKTAFVSMLLVYPFLFIGKHISKKLKKAYDYSKEKSIYLSGPLTFLVFWILLRVWYVVFGESSFIPTTPPNLIMGLVLGFVIVAIFTYIGYWILEKIRGRWEMPHTISYLIIAYIMSLIFWLTTYGAMVVIGV